MTAYKQVLPGMSGRVKRRFIYCLGATRQAMSPCKLCLRLPTGPASAETVDCQLLLSRKHGGNTVWRMIGGRFRQSLGLGPLLAPCTYALHAQQLISLRQFRPNISSTRTVARAASTLQPTKHRKQEPEGQWAAEFRSLGLSPELLVATQEHGLTQPTEIQVKSNATSHDIACCPTSHTVQP